MSGRSSKVETEERKIYVSNLLLQGETTREICRNASEKWSISRRQVERYITSLYTLWHKEFENRRKMILEYHIALRMNLYRIDYEQENYRFCLTTLKDVAKLEGLYDNSETLSQEKTIIVNLPEDLGTSDN